MSQISALSEPPLAWQQRFRAWWVSPAAYPVSIFLLTRLLFLGITYTAWALLAPGHDSQRLAGVPASTIALSWDRWDARWYSAIAIHGYPDVRHSAFFPLMPLAMHLLGFPFAWLLGNDAYYYAGLLIANAAFLGALLVLYRYGCHTWDVPIAQRTILYLALFPKALFTFAPYGESLFLLLAISTYVLLRRGRFALAGILAGLATLDRQVGIVLLIPFALEIYQHHHSDISGWLRSIWSALFVPAALAGYMIFLAITIGHPLGFLEAEVLWKRHFALPPITLIQALTNLRRLPFASTQQFNRLVDLAIILLWLGLLGFAAIPRIRQHLNIPASLLWLGGALTIMPLCAPLTGYAPDLLSSMSRYLMMAFPVFIIAAHFTAHRPRLQEVLLLVSTAFLVVFTIGFIMGYYVV